MTDIIEQADIIARGEVALENETRLSIYERSVIRDLVAELRATRNVLAGIIIERDEANAEVERLRERVTR